MSKPNESGFIVVVVPVIIIVIVVLVLNNRSPKPTYDVKITNYSATNPATLRVDIKVHNTSQVTAKPSCHIEAGSSAYHGVDRVERAEDLKPNEWWGFAQNITATDQGAEYIKDVTVTCK
jgi:hypothetical protein